MSDRSGNSVIRDGAHSAIVPSSRVIRSSELAHVGGRSSHEHHADPIIELITEADVVRAIDVTCSCGKKMRLWCSYEPNSENQNPSVAR